MINKQGVHQFNICWFAVVAAAAAVVVVFINFFFFLKYLFYLFSQYSRILVLEERKNKDMFCCDVVCAISFNFIIVVNFVKLVKMCTYTYIEKNVLYLIYCGHFPLGNVVRAF